MLLGVTTIHSSAQSNIEELVKQGNKYLNKEQFPKALKVFHQAISMDTENASLYFYLGNTYFDQENYTDAINAYNKLRKIGCKLY